MLRAITVSAPKIEGGEVQDKEGRSFEGVLVASVEKAGEKAPLFAAFAVTEGQMKPFWANLRTGSEVALYSLTDDIGYNRKSGAPTLVFPPKEPLQWEPMQRTSKGHLLQIYNRRWFHFTLGRVEPTIEFCLMPLRSRLLEEQERAGLNRRAVQAHFAKLAALYAESQEEKSYEYGYHRKYMETRPGFQEQAAYCKPFLNVNLDADKWECLEAWSELFCAFLLERSGLPMPEAPEFAAQVYIGARATKHLLSSAESGGVTTRGLDHPEVGLTEPLFAHFHGEALREFLGLHVRFFEKALAMSPVVVPSEPESEEDEIDEDDQPESE